MGDTAPKIRRSAWTRKVWPFSRLPSKPAVYAIYFDGELKYIGQSSNLASRFSERARGIRYGLKQNIHTPWGEFPDETSIAIKYHHGWKYGDWAMREIRLICKLKPDFNTHHKRRAQNG